MIGRCGCEMSNLAANGAQITVAWGCGRRFEQVPKSKSRMSMSIWRYEQSPAWSAARDDSAGRQSMYVTGRAESTWPPALFVTLSQSQSQSQSQRPGPVFAALALAAALFLDLGGRAMWSARRERS